MPASFKEGSNQGEALQKNLLHLMTIALLSTRGRNSHDVYRRGEIFEQAAKSHISTFRENARGGLFLSRGKLVSSRGKQ